MKKIIAGFLGIVLVLSVTGGTAYALFSSTATVSNIAFTSGNANLQFNPSIDEQPPEDGWVNSYQYDVYFFQNIYPGFNDHREFWVKNNSSSPINLKLGTKLVSATGDWGVLAPVLTVWLGLDNGSTGVGYSTLVAWSGGVTDLGITLAPSEAKRMSFYLKVPSDADNSIAGKTLSTNWELYGTQTP